MRPIDRGNIPQVNGRNKTVSDYKDWRQDLIDRIGNYCSYCNMTLNDSPQVEHVTPKNPRAGQVAGDYLAWSNMLLGCGPCNRAKGNKPNSIATHYLPDYHNTHLAFNYIIIDHPKRKTQKACIPVPNPSPEVDANKAQHTIDLCKLYAITINKRATDLRWKYRWEAWLSAHLWREEWDNWGYRKPARFAILLADAAIARGFFSIWFQVFHDIHLIKEALINAFPGTDRLSFDPANSYNPIKRVRDDL